MLYYFLSQEFEELEEAMLYYFLPQEFWNYKNSEFFKFSNS